MVFGIGDLDVQSFQKLELNIPKKAKMIATSLISDKTNSKDTPRQGSASRISDGMICGIRRQAGTCKQEHRFMCCKNLEVASTSRW